LNKYKNKKSVLIIDSDNNSASELSKILSHTCTINFAKDIVAGVEAVAAYSPDVVLLGVNSLADEVKFLSKLQSTRQDRLDISVLLITNHDDSNSRERTFKLGVSDYITRPFVTGIVQGKIENQLRIQKRQKAQRLTATALRSLSAATLTDSQSRSALKKLGEFMNLCQVQLYRLEDDEKTMTCLNEWATLGIKRKSKKGLREILEPKTLQAIKKQYKANGNSAQAFITSDSDYSRFIDPARVQFKHYISCPIFVNEKVCGFLDLSTSILEAKWTSSDFELAMHFADIFSVLFEREALQRKFAIVEKAPNIVMAIDQNVNITYANSAISFIAGYAKAEVLRKGPILFFKQDVINQIKDIYIPEVLNKELIIFDVVFLCKNGDEMMVACSLFQIDDNHYSIFVNDLAKLKKLDVENKKVYADSLTGILNRRYFDDNIEKVMADMKEQKEYLTIMMVDIDLFRLYNDTYGHIMGDECLKAVAKSIFRNIGRAGEFVARYDGEEFIIVLPKVNDFTAKKVARKVIDGINNLNITHEKGVEPFVTISIGIATGTVKDLDYKVFVSLSEDMLYQAKDDGRNKFTIGII